MTQRSIKGRDLGEGKEGARAKAWTLLVYASHRPTYCNVGLMNLSVLGPKSWSRHVCLIIALTGQQGPVLYKGNKGVNDAAHSPEGCPPTYGLKSGIDANTCLARMPGSTQKSLCARLTSGRPLALALNKPQRLICYEIKEPTIYWEEIWYACK